MARRRRGFAWLLFIAFIVVPILIGVGVLLAAVSAGIAITRYLRV